MSSLLPSTAALPGRASPAEQVIVPGSSLSSLLFSQLGLSLFFFSLCPFPRISFQPVQWVGGIVACYCNSFYRSFIFLVYISPIVSIPLKEALPLDLRAHQYRLCVLVKDSLFYVCFMFVFFILSTFRWRRFRIPLQVHRFRVNHCARDVSSSSERCSLCSFSSYLQLGK